jgi:hypothetical protein
MFKNFSSKFKLFLTRLMKSIKEFQSLLKLMETLASIIMIYLTRKKISFS